MREKLQTLPLAELKEIAKSQGIKGISGMKKGDLIDLLCEKEKEIEEQKKAAAKPVRTQNQPQICRNWTAGLKQTVFWRLCPTDSASSAVRISCPARMMCMWRLHRFAALT